MMTKDSETKLQGEEKSNINLVSYSCELIDSDSKKSVAEISDADCETYVINEKGDDTKLAAVDGLTIGLGDQCDIELTMSAEGLVNSTDNPNINQWKHFKHGTLDFCCDCHCTRNFQQRDGRTVQLNSGNYDTDKTLLQHLHNHSIGVENDIKQVTFRTRLKLSRKLLPTTEFVNVKSDSKTSKENTLKLRREKCSGNMAVIFGYSVTFIILLCLCGVVFMMNNSSDSRHVVDISNNSSSQFAALNASKQKATQTTTEPRIIMDLPYRAVTNEEFENHIVKSKSAADLLKIFFSDQSLTEEQVNSILDMKTYYIKSSEDRYPKAAAGVDKDMLNDRYAEDQTHARELAYKHMQEVSNHPLSSCSDPQPELVPVEVSSGDIVRHYLPRCTLLHRCRNTSGCCARGAKCGPRSKDGIELVDRYFFVLEQSFDGLQPTNSVLMAKTFVNHTACECTPLKAETNCKKDCPRHFNKKPHGTDCKCICKSSHKHCKQVSRGLAPLEEEGLECIKSGDCIIPECQTGVFMINTGYCPRSRRHEHNKSRGGRHRKRRG